MTSVQPVSPTVTALDKLVVELAHCDTETDEPATFPVADHAPITATVTVAEKAVIAGTEVEVPIPPGLHMELISTVTDFYAPELALIEKRASLSAVWKMQVQQSVVVAVEDQRRNGRLQLEAWLPDRAQVEYEAGEYRISG